MQWKDQMGNIYKLRLKLLRVEVLKFNGKHWAADGLALGFVVEVKTWLGDGFFVRAENMLYTRQEIEARDARISDRMKSKRRLELCDCGCATMKPADEWSSAWGQAAAMVRCEPLDAPNG
jgi:hypothetical protein